MDRQRRCEDLPVFLLLKWKNMKPRIRDHHSEDTSSFATAVNSFAASNPDISASSAFDDGHAGIAGAHFGVDANFGEGGGARGFDGSGGVGTGE